MDFNKQFWYEEMEHAFSKADSRLTEDVETATRYLQNERGHPEENARQLAEFLHRDDSEKAEESQQLSSQSDANEFERSPLLVDGGGGVDLDGDDVDDTDESAAFDDRDPFLWA